MRRSPGGDADAAVVRSDLQGAPLSVTFTTHVIVLVSRETSVQKSWPMDTYVLTRCSCR